MKTSKMFPTVSFHITKPCNMGCKYCYATYENLGRVKMLSLKDAQIIIDKLVVSGIQKITFAGGEPMLHPNISQMIKHVKSTGITSSIITNGSLITNRFLEEHVGLLDWVGLSIDSFDKTVNEKIGRTGVSLLGYKDLLTKFNILGYKVKVNTVVNKYNFLNLLPFLDELNAFKINRLKLLRVLKVKGQNDADWEKVKLPNHQWEALEEFIPVYKHIYGNIQNFVLEGTDDMTASYLLVNPLGQIYENWGAENALSPSLLTHSVDECLEFINLDYEAFEKRGGIYAW